MNTVKTTLLLTALTLLLIYAGGALGGRTGMMFAFVFAIVMNFSAYWFSDKIILSMYKAKPIKREQAPEIYDMVKELCHEAKLPMPKLYVIAEKTPNAFATGRDPHHAAVAVTDGIVDTLSPQELRAVLGHELAHVANRDTLISCIAAAMAGAISMLANMAQWAMIFGGFGGRDEDRNPFVMILMMIIAPLAALLIQMAVSRSREFGADTVGSRYSGDPLSLASALQKLDAASKKHPMKVEPSTAHLFIVNPLRGGGVARLFSTHPPTAHRVKRLEMLAELRKSRT